MAKLELSCLPPRELAAAPLITLLTDFGLKDGYVGAMKGVIARFAPQARVVDITHDIAPQDIRHGGIVWAAVVPFFPPGSIHVAVVDPGVGSERRILAFEALGSVFLAPDNGMIGHVITKSQVRRVVDVRRAEHFLPSVSATFHGRDIFAPVAARLAAGLPLDALGPRRSRFRHLKLPSSRARAVKWKGRRALEIDGEAIHIDAFGNIVTNLRVPVERELRRIEAGGLALTRLSRTYTDVAAGEPLALVGSMGFVELSVNRGNAGSRFGIRVGDRVASLWS